MHPQSLLCVLLPLLSFSLITERVRIKHLHHCGDAMVHCPLFVIVLLSVYTQGTEFADSGHDFICSYLTQQRIIVFNHEHTGWAQR